MIFRQHDIDILETDAHCPFCKDVGRTALTKFRDMVAVVCLATGDQGRICPKCADEQVAAGKAIRLSDCTK